MTSTRVSARPNCLSPERRAAKIKRLGDQANTIGALLSAIHILEDDRQNEALLDCSSSADDFARDLDAFVSDASEISSTAQGASPIANACSEYWTPAGPGTKPPAELPVIAWDGTKGEPCAVFFDPGFGWILQCDPTTIHRGEITHWRYCNAPGGVRRQGATL